MTRPIVAAVVLIAGAAIFTGCAQKPQAENAQQAIEQSKTKGSVEAQAQYLVSQANAFVNSQKFDEAIQSAKYVLANLDANSQEAKSVIEKATEQLKQMAQEKAAAVQKSLGKIGQ